MPLVRDVLLYRAHSCDDAESHATAVDKAREGMVPASDLTAAQSSLSTAEKRVVKLEQDLKAAKAEATSADERAKAAVATAVDERKVLDALVTRKQTDYSGLQDFIKGACCPLIGELL